MPTSPEDLATVERVLDGATLWGAELETRYRVLATTFEPAVGAGPDVEGDRRLQVLFSPVHTILGMLRHRDESGRTVIERFTVEQLVDVVASLDGPTVSAPLFEAQEPAPGEWGPVGAGWSLEGRAQTLDGRTHGLRLALTDGRGRELDLYATFDEVVVRSATGEELRVSALAR